jgi:hypothetical protein
MQFSLDKPFFLREKSLGKRAIALQALIFSKKKNVKTFFLSKGVFEVAWLTWRMLLLQGWNHSEKNLKYWLTQTLQCS